jgi:hypothetical protein
MKKAGLHRLEISVAIGAVDNRVKVGVQRHRMAAAELKSGVSVAPETSIFPRLRYISPSMRACRRFLAAFRDQPA